MHCLSASHLFFFHLLMFSWALLYFQTPAICAVTRKGDRFLCPYEIVQARYVFFYCSLTLRYTFIINYAMPACVAVTVHLQSGGRERVLYSDSLRAGWTEIESWWERDFPCPSRPAPMPTLGPSRGYSSRGVVLTTHPLLVARLRVGWSYTPTSLLGLQRHIMGVALLISTLGAVLWLLCVFMLCRLTS